MLLSSNKKILTNKMFNVIEWTFLHNILEKSDKNILKI